MKASARTQLVGTVTSMRPGAVNDELELTLPGGLAVGARATAFFKASSVILATVPSPVAPQDV